MFLFIVVTLGLLVWAAMIWFSLNLLTFPCDTAYPGFTCGQAIWIEFARQLLLPVLVWLAGAVGIYFAYFR